MKPAELWRPSDKGFIADPYPSYHQILQQARVFQALTGDYVVMGYDEVKQVLQDRTCLAGVRAKWVSKMSSYASSRGLDFQSLDKMVSGMLLQLNPPDHTKLRSFLSHLWPTKSTLEQDATAVVADTVNRLPKGQFDLMPHLAKAIPVAMICKILGLHESDAMQMVNAGLQLVRLMDPYLTYKDLIAIQNANQLLHDHFSAIQPQSTTSLGEQIMQLPSDEAVDLMIFLFIAGYETTATLLGTSLYVLLSQPEIVEQLIDNQAISQFVSEILRMYSPVQLVSRTTTKPIVLSGELIPVDSTLTLCIGAANRDHLRFDAADMLRLNRTTSHLSFGYGIHHCLGNQLAIMEAEETVRQILPVLSKLTLVDRHLLLNKLTVRSIKQMMVNRR